MRRADFITGNGNKLLTTGVAESEANTAHDVYTFCNWDVYNIHDSLTPMDDAMQRLQAVRGAAIDAAKYLTFQKAIGPLCQPIPARRGSGRRCIRRRHRVMIQNHKKSNAGWDGRGAPCVSW